MTMHVTETFLDIGRETDFPVGLGREVRVAGVSIAVFRTTAGAWHALDNRTPHPKGGPLSEAIVSGRYVYCPLRDLKIELETGIVQAPDTGVAKTYPVRLQAGRVQVRL
ncbi:nitrite reductase (NAD(P)H) small subunit [Paenibacillus sp. TRM 82003]|nr:nitrite reductase (NAD(P)H) small subunit [Paenibacillus sp. TRM 82003]